MIVIKFLLERPVKQRVLYRVLSPRLTTNFSAKNQLTTISLANSQLTTNVGYLSTFTFLQRTLFRHRHGSHLGKVFIFAG